MCDGHDSCVRSGWTCLALVAAAVSLGSNAHATAAGFSASDVSPDRVWSVVYSRANGYGRLDLTDRTTGRRSRMYRSNDSCCAQMTWVRRHTLVFVDDYNVRTLDPVTRRVTRIAGFSNFVVSPNARWIAGWASCGGHCAQTVEVVPLAGGACKAVRHQDDQDDSFPFFSSDSRRITVDRHHFDTKRGADRSATRGHRRPLRPHSRPSLLEQLG
jgi:hypothetical protein